MQHSRWNAQTRLMLYSVHLWWNYDIITYQLFNSLQRVQVSSIWIIWDSLLCVTMSEHDTHWLLNDIHIDQFIIKCWHFCCISYYQDLVIVSLFEWYCQRHKVHATIFAVQNFWCYQSVNFFKDKNFSIYMYKIGDSLSQPCTSEWIIANVRVRLCGTAKWASLYYYLCSKI